MPRVHVVSCLAALSAFAAGCGSGSKGGTSSGTTTGSSTMCSTHCGAHAYCDIDGGNPTCACRAGYQGCMTDAGLVCTDLQTDSDNCGICGKTCTAPESCGGGKCSCVQSGVIANCSGECADLRSDPNHCGGCKGPTAVCGAGQICTVGDAGGLGTCQCPDETLTGCPNGCFDLTMDPFNCGCCGTGCLPGDGAGTLTCTNGACDCPGTTIQCPTANDACGSCTDTDWDPNNCSGCGNVCYANGAPVTCDAGTCFCGESGTGTICPDFSCPDFTTDVNNCGGCGNVCVHPTPFCVGGTCADAGVF